MQVVYIAAAAVPAAAKLEVSCDVKYHPPPLWHTKRDVLLVQQQYVFMSPSRLFVFSSCGDQACRCWHNTDVLVYYAAAEGVTKFYEGTLKS